mgnify:FL=1
MRRRHQSWWRALLALGVAGLAALPFWIAEAVWLLVQFVVAGVVLFTAAITTETGTALLTRWVDRMVPALQIAYESGTLRTGVVWRNLGWRDEALTVRVDRVTIALDWGALARRTVHLHALELERATVTVKPQLDDAPPSDWRAELDALAATLKAVPVAIAVDRFAATALTIHHPAMTAPYRIDRLSWRGALRATDATLDDLLVASADGALSGALTAEWRTVPRVSAALTARHGSAQLVVAGAGDADGTVEMHLRFAAPQLAELPLVKQLRLPLAGRVVVEGAMRGPWHTPELALEAAFDRLTWGDAPPIDRIRGQLTGTLARHEIRVQAASAPGSVALTVAGAARTGADDAAFAWQGALTAFTITSPQLGVWRLRKASALTWRPGAWQVAPLCLTPGEAAGELCLSAQQRPEAPVSAHATARFPLATVQRLARPWLPEASPVATLKLDGTLTAQVDWTQPETIAAQAQVSIPSLAPFAPLVPDVTGIDGRAMLDAAVSGTIAAPQVAATLTLHDGTVTLPQAGVGLRLPQARLALAPDRTLTLSATVASTAGGTLTVTGTGTAAWPDWSAAVQIRGERFAAMRVPELALDLAPALSVWAQPSGAVVHGRVVVPSATLRVQTLPEGVVGESDDLVYADAPQEKTSGYPVALAVETVLGDAVRVEGYGFTTRLIGALMVRRDPPAPPTGTGTIALVDGRYRGYGVDLAVRSGSVTFAGPLSDPIVEAEAVRTLPNEGLVGLRLWGPVSKLKSELFAEPARPEGEMLSLLITGQPLGSGGTSLGLLLTAARGLGLTQADSVLQDLGQAFGFDEVGIATTETGTTEWTLGKRLAPNVVARYYAGAEQGVGRLVIAWQLRPVLALQITAGARQGIEAVLRSEKRR